MSKPAKPKILKVVRTDSFVKIRQELHRSSEQKTAPDKNNPGLPTTKTVNSSSEVEETAHEAPLPAFDTALQALAAVACNVMGLGAPYAKGVNVVSVALSYTNTGIRTAVIGFTKQMDSVDGQHPMKTPAFQIDDGKKPEDGRMQCAKQHAETVKDFIKQAQRYAAGERSQQLLKFDESDDEDVQEDDDTAPLPFVSIKPAK
jgi:hypothetical protein